MMSSTHKSLLLRMLKDRAAKRTGRLPASTYFIQLSPGGSSAIVLLRVTSHHIWTCHKRPSNTNAALSLEDNLARRNQKTGFNVERGNRRTLLVFV